MPSNVVFVWLRRSVTSSPSVCFDGFHEVLITQWEVIKWTTWGSLKRCNLILSAALLKKKKHTTCKYLFCPRIRILCSTICSAQTKQWETCRSDDRFQSEDRICMKDERVDVCGVHSKVIFDVRMMRRCTHAHREWNKTIDSELTGFVFVSFLSPVAVFWQRVLSEYKCVFVMTALEKWSRPRGPP